MVKAFADLYAAKRPKAAEKIIGEVEDLFVFYDYPAEHWIHLRTTNPIVIWRESSPVVSAHC